MRGMRRLSGLSSPRHLPSGVYLPPPPNGYHLRPVNQRNTIPGQPFYLVHQPNIGRNKGVNLPLRRGTANCGAGSCRHNQAMTAIYRAVAAARPPSREGGRGGGRALPCTTHLPVSVVPESIAGTHLLSRRAVPRRN